MGVKTIGMNGKTNVIKEEVLVEKAREGDLVSFTALVEMYQERAVRIAYSFVGNFEDARDLAQEAFVKAYGHLAEFKEESQFYTWLYRIIVNACKDFLRKKKIRQHLYFWVRRDGENEEVDLSAQAVDRAKDAAEELINRELGDEIYKALRKLPFQQRSAFTLRYLEGLSLQETADTMNLSVGAVKANVWQAGEKMKKFLSHVAEEV